MSLSIEGGREIIRPASWKLQGHLVILHVTGPQAETPWRRGGSDGSPSISGRTASTMRLRMAPMESRSATSFSRGIGGMWGTVPSGLFPHALEKARYIALPAVNHDFESIRDLSRWETPDFSMIRDLLGAGLDAVPEPAC